MTKREYMLEDHQITHPIIFRNYEKDLYYFFYQINSKIFRVILSEQMELFDIPNNIQSKTMHKQFKYLFNIKGDQYIFKEKQEGKDLFCIMELFNEKFDLDIYNVFLIDNIK